MNQKAIAFIDIEANQVLQSENLEILKKQFLNKNYFNKNNNGNLFIFDGHFLDKIFMCDRKMN